MKLLALNEVAFDGSGRVYRQGRVQAIVSTLVLGGILVGAPFLWFHVGAPWPVWVLCAGLATFIVPMLLGDLAAKFRSTNWLLWVREGGLWINFRSYQDQSSNDESCILFLNYDEIAQVRKHNEKYTTPGSQGGSVHYSLHSFEIELAHQNTESLAKALAENRRREQPQRFYFGIGVRSRPSHFPVSLPAAGKIRIAWRGGVGNWVAPSLAHLLRELAPHAGVAEPGRQVHADWSEMSKPELEKRILSLVQAGAKLDAINVLVRRYGYSATRARHFVDDLIAVSAS